MNNVYTYKVVQVDAWADGEEGMWTWNQSFDIGEFTTPRGSSILDDKEQFIRYLNELGITWDEGSHTVEFVNDGFELIDATTYEPKFAALLEEIKEG